MCCRLPSGCHAPGRCWRWRRDRRCEVTDCRRLDPDASDKRSDRGRNGRWVAGVHLGDRQPRGSLTNAMEKTPSPAIKVVGGDDMGSLIEKLPAPPPRPQGPRRKQNRPRRFRAQQGPPRTRRAFGLPEREYSQPVFTPGEDCTKVAVAKMGVMTEPVFSSRLCRPWIARVERAAGWVLSLVIVSHSCRRRLRRSESP